MKLITCQARLDIESVLHEHNTDNGPEFKSQQGHFKLMTLEDRIGIDAQGGDTTSEGPVPVRVVNAILQLAPKHKNKTFYLVGDAEELHKLMSIGSEKRPLNVIIPEGYKHQVLQGLTSMVENKEIIGFYTLGNTIWVAAAIRKIGFLGEFKKLFPEAKQPPLLAEFPKSPRVKRVQSFYLLDAGSAPMLTRPEQFLLYANIGAVYAQVMGRQNPAIGLLNIGKEPTKGSPLLKDAYALLQSSRLNFVGNVEPYTCVYDAEKESQESRPVDVVITDALGGNWALKWSSTAASMAGDVIREEIKSGGPIAKLAGWLLKLSGVFSRAKERLDPNSYGGAPFVGLNAPVFKGHGTTTTQGICNGIEKLITYIENNCIQKIKEESAKIPN